MSSKELQVQVLCVLHPEVAVRARLGQLRVAEALLGGLRLRLRQQPLDQLLDEPLDPGERAGRGLCRCADRTGLPK
eukprot:8450186-Heterocapsa_arctica.AAC.1